MTKSSRCRSRSPVEELFEHFPRGLALLELVDTKDISTWRLAGINRFASSLVVPSIETFISSERLRLGPFVDLPELYREINGKRCSKTIGMVETRQGPNQRCLFAVSVFPAGARSVGILFEEAHSFISGRSAREQAERQLAQTCEFLGAILWKAEPGTLRFTYVSQEAQAILGYWLERWTGETDFWRKHLFPEDRERVAGACANILRERRRQNFEFRMISVHGQILWFHAAAEVVEQPGRPPELAGVMNDITDLKHAEERIRALSSRLIRVQDDERRHISRELHDSLGQYLTSIKMNVDLVKRESVPADERHRTLLAESSETLEKCVQELRSVSYLLHPPLLDELGLLAALRWYTAGFSERSGIDVNLDTPAQFSRLPAEMELALFRIVQESLTNIQRHSGSDMAWVTLSEHNDRAEVTVTDRGVGVPADVIERIERGRLIEGVGLRGMYERVREQGGQLGVQSGGAGTVVSAVIPLRKHEIESRDSEKLRRVAGKRMETSDVRIENVASAANGAGEAGTREFRRTAAPQRRRASRRQT